MSEGGSEGWMWAEACEMLARAERLHRQFFQPARGRAQTPTWEPPADVVETDREVLIRADERSYMQYFAAVAAQCASQPAIWRATRAASIS